MSRNIFEHFQELWNYNLKREKCVIPVYIASIKLPTVNHCNSEQEGMETLVMRLTRCAWRSIHVLISSILKLKKTIVDVPDVSNKFSRLGNDVVYVVSIS